MQKEKNFLIYIFVVTHLYSLDFFLVIVCLHKNALTLCTENSSTVNLQSETFALLRVVCASQLK